jgi:hypothetical protein
MGEVDLPPHGQKARSTFLYAAGGGFGGALLAIVVAKILSGPCCCPHEGPEKGDRPARAAATVSEVVFGNDSLFA